MADLKRSNFRVANVLDASLFGVCFACFPPCLHGVSPSRLPPIAQKHTVSLTCDSKLLIGVTVYVNVCL